jgi:hypothetical protein
VRAWMMRQQISTTKASAESPSSCGKGNCDA